MSTYGQWQERKWQTALPCWASTNTGRLRTRHIGHAKRSTTWGAPVCSITPYITEPTIPICGPGIDRRPCPSLSSGHSKASSGLRCGVACSQNGQAQTRIDATACISGLELLRALPAQADLLAPVGTPPFSPRQHNDCLTEHKSWEQPTSKRAIRNGPPRGATRSGLSPASQSVRKRPAR